MSLVKTSGGGKPGNGEDGYAFDGQVSLALAQIWEIFDYPCGQRLKSILETELIRLMNLGELLVSEEVALRLKTMSSATIDRKLKHQREVLHLLRSRHTPKLGSLPGCQIPIRLTQWDTSKVGYIEMDLVVHCGSSTLGEYINTLSTTEISSGWWVRKVFGYLRYDTGEELALMNDLYRNELRLYKNFFPPVMKLKSKERIGGRVKRQYDTPKTPYQRLMDSGQIREETKGELERLYLRLNPAELKRAIDAKLDKLYRAYERKSRSGQVDPSKKVVPHSVTNYMIKQSPIGLHG